MGDQMFVEVELLLGVVLAEGWEPAGQPLKKKRAEAGWRILCRINEPEGKKHDLVFCCI